MDHHRGEQVHSKPATEALNKMLRASQLSNSKQPPMSPRNSLYGFGENIWEPSSTLIAFDDCLAQWGAKPMVAAPYMDASVDQGFADFPSIEWNHKIASEHVGGEQFERCTDNRSSLYITGTKEQYSNTRTLAADLASTALPFGLDLQRMKSHKQPSYSIYCTTSTKRTAKRRPRKRGRSMVSKKPKAKLLKKTMRIISNLAEMPLEYPNESSSKERTTMEIPQPFEEMHIIHQTRHNIDGNASISSRTPKTGEACTELELLFEGGDSILAMG